MAVAQPHPQMSAGTGLRVGLLGGDELGTISIADGVVSQDRRPGRGRKPRRRQPAAARMLGRAVPGAGHLGVRGTDLQALPKTSVEVDGSKAFVTLEISVRWPASVPEITGGPPPRPRPGIRKLTGLDVDESPHHRCRSGHRHHTYIRTP